MDEFLIRALAGGCGVALVVGPLGSFVVWQRLAYFGATLAHSALLGVALGLLIGFDLNLGVLLVCIGLAVLLVLLQQGRHRLPGDTLLGIISHAALAFGLIGLSFLRTVRVDLMGYLFGDILAVKRLDLLWIYGGGALVLLGLALLWRRLLALTVHADLARVEGVPVLRLQLAFMLLMAVVIAIAMKIVGVLLIISLLIIPAATARRFAASPEQMAALAAAIGVVAVVLGLLGSLTLDLPSGPAVVAAATLLFAAALLLPAGRTI